MTTATTATVRAARGASPGGLLAAALIAGLAAVLVAAGCGGEKKRAKGEGEGDGEAAAAARHDAARAAAPPPVTLGVEDPAAFNYTWGKGAKAYRPVAAALKKEDWRAVRGAAEQAIAADPGHLDAHRALAGALAQMGENEQAMSHLQIALAADWARWGGAVETDADLEPLLSSPSGDAVRAMNAALREDFVRRARAGLLVVARRAPFKPASGARRARVSSRAELFVHDRELGRYLRLTHTGFGVIAALPSSTGDEIAFVVMDRVDPAIGSGSGARPPALVQTRVGTVSLADPTLRAPLAVLPAARTLSLAYLAGDELVVTAHARGDSYWGDGAATPLAIDRASGKTRPARPVEPGTRRLLVRYEGVQLEDPARAEGIAADWTPEAGTAEEFVLESSKKRVQLPRGEAARRNAVAWSPDRRRLALVTAADPCAASALERQAALYLVDVESGRLTHAARGTGPFHPVFLDANLVAYEDDEGGVRFHDASVGRERGRLSTRGGLGRFGVGAARTALCMREDAPPPGEAAAEPGAPPAAGGEPGAAPAPSPVPAPPPPDTP